MAQRRDNTNFSKVTNTNITGFEDEPSDQMQYEVFTQMFTQSFKKWSRSWESEGGS